MSQTRANGPAAVAAMLRKIADDLSGQPASLAGVILAPQSDVAAVSEAAHDEPPGTVVVHVRIIVGTERHEMLPVEQELIHPGG